LERDQDRCVPLRDGTFDSGGTGTGGYCIRPLIVPPSEESPALPSGAFPFWAIASVALSNAKSVREMRRCPGGVGGIEARSRLRVFRRPRYKRSNCLFRWMIATCEKRKLAPRDRPHRRRLPLSLTKNGPASVEPSVAAQNSERLLRQRRGANPSWWRPVRLSQQTT
jgi:hypothetical protein